MFGEGRAEPPAALKVKPCAACERPPAAHDPPSGSTGAGGGGPPAPAAPRARAPPPPAAPAPPPAPRPPAPAMAGPVRSPQDRDYCLRGAKLGLGVRPPRGGGSRTPRCADAESRSGPPPPRFPRTSAAKGASWSCPRCISIRNFFPPPFFFF